MERRGHLTQQYPGGLDIQRRRQLPGRGVGVHRRLHGGQRGRRRGHLPPRLGLLDDFGATRVLSQERRPPGERRPARRQGYGLSIVVLGPRDVEVFQQNSPRYRVDRQVVNEHRQLTRGGHPQCTEHHPGRRVQLRPRFQQRLVGQHVHRLQAFTGIHRTGLRHLERPTVCTRCRRAAAAWRAGPAAPAARPLRRLRSPPREPAPPRSG